MIVLNRESQIFLVSQLEHQDLAGQIASFWGNENFSTPEPFSSVVAAASDHDIGWWEEDTHPTVNPDDGMPYTFTKLPLVQWLTMYEKGIARVTECDPYEGLLVGMHGVGLRKNRYGTVPATDRKDRLVLKAERKALDGFIKRGESSQKRLRTKISKIPHYKRYASKGHIWSNYKLLQILDRLSLYLCSDGLAGGIKDGVLAPCPSIYGEGDVELLVQKRSEEEVAINPFPLKKSPAKLSLSGRFVPKKRYRDNEEFRRAYGAAECVVLNCNIVDGM